MLNSYYNKTESKVVAVTKEIEKTISPDKVTEMYDKVYEQVKSDFVRTFEVKSDYMNGVVIEIHHDYAKRTKTLHTRFKLNEEEYRFEDVVEYAMDVTPPQAYERFAKHYIEELTRKLMKKTAEVLFSK